MEENSETKELEPLKKISVSISVFQGYFKDLAIDGEQSILEAEALQKQVKAIKSLAKSSTEIEWQTKKTAYEESRDKTAEKKKEYYEIRDKRNILMNACADIFNGIKKKIEDFRAECVRKAEEERRAEEKKEEANRKRIAAESKAAKEEERRVEAEKKFRAELVAKKETLSQSDKEVESKQEMKVIRETGVTISAEYFIHGDYEGEECPTRLEESMTPDYGQINATETTEPGATTHPQKPEEDQNGPVLEEVDILNANIWDAICGDLENFKLVEIKIVDKWRHGTEEIAIVESFETGKRYQSNFRDSCKEMDFEDMNGDEANFFEIKSNEIKIEITSFNTFIRACVMGEDGATTDLLIPDIEAITELARKKGCKIGDVVVPGCELRG